MAKERLFDWYNFLTKKILKCKIFEVKKKVCMALWSDKEISQGKQFNIHALFANPWDCPVTINLNLKVTPKVLLPTKKKSGRLILPRQWQVELAPAEIALVTAAGYACFDCKPCSVLFNKAKVSKQGRGKCIFKRKGKPFGPSISPLGLLFLPLGFIVISWSAGLSIMMKIGRNKLKTQDEPQNLQERCIEHNTLWSPGEPDRLNLAPLLNAYYNPVDERTKSEVEEQCIEAYSKWAQKYKAAERLNILRTMELEEAQEQSSLVVC